MGLSSVFSTAISGLQASETVIDVSGNNIANANTAGFKASNVQFATQFLQTLSIGSAPSGNLGGTNPQQIGLGALVSSISPDFSQGTLQISSNPSDLAIQGDGFFTVQTQNGQQLYTRNGAFKLNGNNQLVTANGDKVLGFGVDSGFNIQSTNLVPISIPLGSAAVAKATQNVSLQGTLSPSGAVATTAAITQTGALGDSSFASPNTSGTTAAIAPTPDIVGPGTTATAASSGSGGMTASSTYSYEVVFVDAAGKESMPSAAFSATLGGSDDSASLANIPTDSTGKYVARRIYRTDANGTTYKLLTTINDNTTTNFTDSTADGSLGASLNTTTLTGNYSYYVTFATATGGPGHGFESAPSSLVGPLNVINGRVVLSNLPTDSSGQYTVRRIYRCSATDPNSFTFVTEIPNNTAGVSYTDNNSDASIASNAALDMTGPRATTNTLLINLMQNSTTGLHHVFSSGGTLTLSATKGGRTLTTKSLTVTNNTTVLDLVTFMQQATGIQTGSGSDPANPIPTDGGSGLAAGGYVTANGQLELVSNNGTDNAVAIGESSLQFTPSGGTIAQSINLNFNQTQAATGSGAVADFLVYDSLGIPLNVRVTMELQSQNGSQSTFRWFADAAQNDPASGAGISAGTGLVTFDGNGKLLSTSNSTLSIQRAHVPSNKPLSIDLDFSQVSGLAATTNSLAAGSQDGFAPGKLTSYTIGTDGIITGSFDNGTQRDLGQIRLARFANPSGLSAQGQNLFAAGVNSGLAVLGNPGSDGIGTISSGAIELSNTDLSKSLISLISASEQYQGNARVIQTAQQLLTTLININGTV
ncbi:MAG: flagellar hook-basal body complex protein [Planctomycetes bacterium]|nr:flagellar hook-basal body complex protein [Planctomycetota bacterium]